LISDLVLYFIGGVLVSLVGSMSGIGGGVFMVPLFYYMGYPIEKAIGTSLFVIVFNGVSATISYWARGVLRLGSWILVALLMAPSSMVGALVASIAPRALLRAIVALIVLAFGLNLLLRGPGAAVELRYKGRVLAPATGVIAGFIAGLSGIGGGAILLPVLISVLKVPVREAVAASMLSIVVSSTFGSIVHIANGNVIFNLAAPFALGAVVGAQIGSFIAARSRPRILAVIVGTVLVVVGILTLLNPR